MKRLLGLSVVCFLGYGCINTGSLNYQCSALRASTDIATTAGLEEGKVTEADRVKVEAIATELLKYLESGSTAGLTSGQITMELTARIPAGYQAYFQAGLALVSANSVDLKTVIPSDILRRLIAAVKGIKNSSIDFVVVVPVQ